MYPRKFVIVMFTPEEIKSFFSFSDIPSSNSKTDAPVTTFSQVMFQPYWLKTYLGGLRRDERPKKYL